MRGDEQRVVNTFCAWLAAAGWAVEREVEFVDVRATRGGQRLLAEAKGRTTAPGLDVDTMFGQLLRRMPPVDDPNTRYAVVVPWEARKAVERIPRRLLDLLRIDVFVVTAQDEVQHVT